MTTTPRGGSWGNPRTTTPVWRRLRLVILDRDHGICHVCHMPGATQVDHINGNHNDNTITNLAAIHDNPCHRRKSSAEGHAAKREQRIDPRRPPEPHPGHLPTL